MGFLDDMIAADFAAAADDCGQKVRYRSAADASEVELDAVAGGHDPSNRLTSSIQIDETSDRQVANVKMVLQLAAGSRRFAIGDQVYVRNIPGIADSWLAVEAILGFGHGLVSLQVCGRVRVQTSAGNSRR